MSTFTAFALDRLLEPGVQKSPAKPLSTTKSLDRESSSNEKKVRRGYISPTLYTTPEVTPLPDSPTPFPPSPYVVNHKRRGSNLLKSASQSDVILSHQSDEEGQTPVRGLKDENNINSVEDASCTAKVSNLSSCTDDLHDDNVEKCHLDDETVCARSSPKLLTIDSVKDFECDDFFDPQESLSIASNGDAEKSVVMGGSWRQTMPDEEYLDANEDLSSEGSFFSARAGVLSELREMRLNLLMEIEQRKQAEESLSNMQTQWERIAVKLMDVGLTLSPASALASAAYTDGDSPNVVDPAEDLCRQVLLARFVAESVGRGSARAEVELEMESQISAKNFEITRLGDRLRYYEAVNHEMSQRNREAVDTARRNRQRRNKRQIWFWRTIGLAVGLGSAALAWSYLQAPSRTNSSSTSHGSLDVTAPDVC